MSVDTSGNGSDSFFNSPGFAALISAGGAGLSAIGAAGQSKAEREAQQRQLIANYLSGQQSAQRTAGMGTEAALGGPTGLSDAVAHDQIRRQILGSARNISITPPAGIAQYMPQVSGGARLPEGGLDVGALSDESLMASLKPYLAANAQANPWGATPDTSHLNLGPSGGSVGSDVEAYRQGQLGQNGSQQDQIMSYLNGSAPINPASGGSPDSGAGHTSFLHKLGSVLKVAAPIAASVIPGLGPIAGALIAGGGAAAGGAMQGDTIKNILLGGGMGAATGALATKSPFKIPRAVATPNTNLTSPGMNWDSRA